MNNTTKETGMIALKRMLMWFIRKTHPDRNLGRFLPKRFSDVHMRLRMMIERAHVTVSGGGSENMNGKVCAYIYAGRRDRMSLMLEYLDELFAEGQVDYIHLWNFARNNADREWVRSLANKDGYCVLEITDGEILQNMYRRHASSKKDWSYFFVSAHNYYAQNRFDGCAFIKIDDDIVFMDVPRFKVFRDELMKLVSGENKNCHMISANVVNNMVCDHFRQLDDVIPSDNADFPGPLSSWVPGSSSYEYFGNGYKSQTLHDFFLNNPERLIANKNGLHLVEKGTWVNINFIGFSNKVFPVLKWDDEPYLTIDLSKKLNKRVGIVNEFTVAHLSFGSQPEQNDTELLIKYRELRERTPLLPAEEKQ